MIKKLAIIPFVLLILIVIISLFLGHNPISIPANPDINSGDTAWMLTSAAFVLIMTPDFREHYTKSIEG